MMKGFVSSGPKSVLLLLQFIFSILLLLHPLPSSAESVTYQYDALHRLIGATYDNGVTIGYTYDNVGNRLTETIASNTSTAVSPSVKGNMVIKNKALDKNIFSSDILPPITEKSLIAGAVLGYTETSSRITYEPFIKLPMTYNMK